jgi:uncharacterized metal-binding protein YceD (DUF177 family)
MDPLRKYEIAFVGLKDGVHEFQFDVDDQFFENFKESLVEKGSVSVRLNFEKHSSFFMLHFHLSGKLPLPCDRCGVTINFPVETDNSVVIKFDQHREGDKDDSMADVIYINRNETHLSVAQLIYEFISLSVPVNHITCDNLKGAKPCDEKVLERLHEKEKEMPRSDPRWEQLRKIKFN